MSNIERFVSDSELHDAVTALGDDYHLSNPDERHTFTYYTIVRYQGGKFVDLCVLFVYEDYMDILVGYDATMACAVQSLARDLNCFGFTTTFASEHMTLTFDNRRAI